MNAKKTSGGGFEETGKTFGVTKFGCIAKQNDLPTRLHTGNAEANAAMKLVVPKVRKIHPRHAALSIVS